MAVMKFDYKCKRWLLLRKRVLKRDGYLCRESLRYGKRIPAETVHHIFPVSERPDLMWNENNLISLSASAHDKMHDRESGRVTEAGKYWQGKAAAQIHRQKTGQGE